MHRWTVPFAWPGSCAVLLAGATVLFVLAAACGGDTGAGSEAEETFEFQKVTASDRVYSYEDFAAVGFKKRKDYNVEGLTRAVGAWYGFWQPEGEDTREYEVRVYPSHVDAVEYGTALAEEGTGADAVLTSNKATWAEGVRERRSTGGPGGGAAQGGPAARSGHAPRYADFAIYGNVILLCEGADSKQSLERCEALVRAVEAATGQ